MGRTSDARTRLIDATIDLVWPASYGVVGVDAICEKAGVKKGSFYHFFSGKDELMVAALDTHWQNRRVGLDRVFSSSIPPLERLRGYFAHVLQRQTDVQAKYGRILGCFHNSVATECIQSLPEIAAKVQQVLSSYRSYLESALRDAQAAGDMRAGDPAADAKTLFAFVEGSLTQARIHDDLEILRRLPEGGFALLGITTPAAKRPRPASKASATTKTSRTSKSART